MTNNNNMRFLRNATLEEAEIQSDQMDLKQNVDRWRKVKRFSSIDWDNVNVTLESWNGNDLYDLIKTKTHVHEDSIVGSVDRLIDKGNRPPRIWNG